ncbi:MAG: hypothetical protein HY741_02480 [Chloroflexi bacterium]|nr:hypothetical protein [Chloroflexota bacterium]
MPKSKKTWVYAPHKPAPARAPDDLKTTVQHKADELIKTVLAPRHINPPPDDSNFNYIVALYAKWYGRYFYFYAKYASPGPYSIAPFFETKFARLEYIGDDKFNLSFMRHTDDWFESYQNLLLAECLNAIQNDPWFQP